MKIIERVEIMPIKVHDNLPAKQILANEDIYLIDESRAFHQDIRPLKIAILNLMPDKQATEVQLLRLLGNTPLQIDITLLYTKTHNSKHTPREYLLSFYQEFSQVMQEKLDGLIITGAPVEQMDFEQVTYWDELKAIMEWSKHNVTSTLHICWGAQAGLYYHYNIQKYPLEQKMCGIFEHTLLDKSSALFKGFDDKYYVPHSRYTEVRREDILKVSELRLLSESAESGVNIVATKDLRQIFIAGHSEYDSDTLHKEYLRDLEKGINPPLPKNYYIDSEKKQPICLWRAHGMLMFSNWINHVYQETPYELV